LLNSTATFKFIMNGPAITQLLFDPYDRWEAYPVERAEMLEFITTNSLQNVVWLSTDLHAIVVSPVRLDTSPSSIHTVPEVVEGPIGENTLLRELPPSILGLLGSIPGILTQVSDFVVDHYNNVLLTVDPTATPQPTATLDFYDRTGAIIRTI